MFHIVGSYGSQEVNGVLAQVHLTLVSVGTQTHSVVIPPVLEYIIGTDIFSNLYNPHISSLRCGAKDVMMTNHHNNCLYQGR